MSRPIKCRAWHPEWKRFIYFKPLELIINSGITTYALRAEQQDLVIFHRFSTQDVIIQQFTGLQDINEKDIYEGDIVKTVPHPIITISADPPPNYIQGEIKFFSGAFHVCSAVIGATLLSQFFCGGNQCALEVIGHTLSK